MGGMELHPAWLPAPGAGPLWDRVLAGGTGTPCAVCWRDGRDRHHNICPDSDWLCCIHFIPDSEPSPFQSPAIWGFEASTQQSTCCRGQSGAMVNVQTSVSLRCFPLPNTSISPSVKWGHSSSNGTNHGKLCSKQEINEGMMMMPIMTMIMIIQPFGREECIFGKKIPSDALKILISF